MNIALRHYQTEAIEQAIQAFKNGVTRQILTLPTGSGKTIIMAALAETLGKRTLLLAHREELITQAMDKFNMVWPEADKGICMANQDDPDRQIVFGSVQTCCRPQRLAQLQKNGFELLLIDEAHHANSESYQTIIRSLGFAAGDKNRLMVGVTATPMRSDEKELGNVFEKITYSISIATMIKSGYLSPVVGRRILTRTSLNDVRMVGGDFALSELSEKINTPERNKFIVDSYKKYAAHRKGLAFCCDVQHCHDLAEAFKTAHIRAISVYGSMGSLERRNALHGLKNGEFQIATSCGVLTEGFDEPAVSCIAMARPTKFKGLYIQCIGRGLRLHPSKADCLVLDFADEGHNLETVASIRQAIPHAQYVGEGCGIESTESKVQSINIRRVCDEEFDILGATRFIWVQVGDGEWSLADDEGNEIVMTPSDNSYVAHIYWRNGRTQSLVSTPLPIEYCSGTCEDFARVHFKLNYASAESPWLNSQLPPTEGQIAFLEKKNIDASGMTKAQASLKIREVVAKQRKHYRKMSSEPATIKQMYFLQAIGVNPRGMTKLEATRAIAQIKKENNVVNA